MPVLELKNHQYFQNLILQGRHWPHFYFLYIYFKIKAIHAYTLNHFQINIYASIFIKLFWPI
jgi:hypothetical protein